jgi:hypothetical protein
MTQGLRDALSNAQLLQSTHVAPVSVWALHGGSVQRLRDHLDKFLAGVSCWVIPMSYEGHWSHALVTDRVMLLDPMPHMHSRQQCLCDGAHTITVLLSGRLRNSTPAIVVNIKTAMPIDAGTGKHCFCCSYLSGLLKEWLTIMS